MPFQNVLPQYNPSYPQSIVDLQDSQKKAVALSVWRFCYRTFGYFDTETRVYFHKDSDTVAIPIYSITTKREITSFGTVIDRDKTELTNFENIEPLSTDIFPGNRLFLLTNRCPVGLGFVSNTIIIFESLQDENAILGEIETRTKYTDL